MAKYHLWIVANVCLVLGLIYSYPQMNHNKKGYNGPAILHVDEFSYLSRLTRASQDSTQICNMWVIEKKGEPCLVPALAETVLSLPMKLFGASVESTLAVYRPLLAILGFLIFYKALISLGLPFLGALIVALGCYILPGAWYFKPGISLINGMDLFAFTRFTNPLFSLLIFLPSWCLSFRGFFDKSFGNALAGGIFLGLSFYVSIFYWSHLCLIFFLYFILFARDQWKIFLNIVVASVLVSAPYWYHSFTIFSHPVYETMGWRLGVFIRDRGWFLLKNYSLIPYVLMALFLVVRGKTVPYRWMGISFLAGVICYYSPILTGLEFQNFHYKYTLVPFSLVILFMFGSYFLNEVRFRWSWCAVAILIVMSVNGAFKIVKFANKQSFYTTNPEVQAYGPVFNYLATQNDPQKVILASEKTMSMVPFRTGHRIFQDSAVEFTSNQELFDRNIILWTLMFDGEPDELKKHLMPVKLQIPIWIFGFPQSLEDEYRQKSWPPLGMQEQEYISSTIVDIFKNKDPKETLGGLKNYQLDYVILGPLESDLKRHIEKFLNLEKIEAFGEVELFSVNSLKY